MAPPAVVAELWAMVVLVAESVPALSMAPALVVAVLYEKVTSVIVAEALATLARPPPEAAVFALVLLGPPIEAMLMTRVPLL